MKARTYNTAGEMRASFRSASNKRQQIVVLADLNECGLNEVAEVVLGCCDLSQHELNWIKRDILIDQLWREGKSDHEISQAVGRSPATISSWRQRNGRENLVLAQAHRKQDSKRCKTCQQMLPTTTKFFHREARCRDGFQNECKACRKNRRLEREALEKQGLKRCKTCEGVFPATLEFFYSNGRGLLQTECKTCRKAAAKRYYKQQKARTQA